jgi:hypothetical protein
MPGKMWIKLIRRRGPPATKNLCTLSLRSLLAVPGTVLIEAEASERWFVLAFRFLKK